MPFTDIFFIYFIAIFFALLLVVQLFAPRKVIQFIAVSSFLFVAFNFPLFALIPLCQSLFLHFFCRKQRKKPALIATLIFLLFPLLLFKYSDFALEQFSLSKVYWPLPLGISFYTFTAIGLAVDHYEDYKSTKGTGFFKVLNFLTFWPHLASGPILRTGTFLNKEIIPFRSRAFDTAFVLIVYGFYKKLVIADGAAGYVEQNLALGFADMGTIDVLATSVGFLVRIYGDFSGYSDMAIGFALLMGIRMPANFNYPYLATSLTDFWRRWHISLSTWFRDYIFFPMGGSRVAPPLMLLAILVTFTTSGLWHGAAWSFVVWGVMHGLALCVEKIASRYFSLPVILAWPLTFAFVLLTWVFFFLPIGESVEFLSHLFHVQNPDKPYNGLIFLFLFALVVIDFTFKPYVVVEKHPVATRIGVILIPIVIFLTMFFSGSPQPFIYFDF